MGVMTCPHCEESIDSLTRTGDKKYSCGQCNMVIKYDDVQPHLDEMEVIDKRGSSDSNNGQSNNSGNVGFGQQVQGQNQSPNPQAQNHSLNEREKIYQRGTDGLREIKKERMKNWLASTEGVGGQTEQRITMVFDRNESVHRNPHVLYNLLDDELNASASYLNTMVQDIFAPEEEHADLLQSQGYTPWHSRANQSNNMNQSMGQGGPMNATGATNFAPGNAGMNQQQQQQGGMQQGGQGQQGQGQQQQNQGGGNDGISREEAEMMMRQAVTQSNQEEDRRALLSGLSDATDEALREMAGNVGGLAGTVQRVIDEALVEYARENPEWVINNMDILQKVLGATEDMDSGGSNEPEQSQEDAKVDSALESITGQQNQNPQSQQTQQQQYNTGGQQQQNNPNRNPNNPVQQQNQPQNTQPQQQQAKNPDIDNDLMGNSGFEPNPDTQDPGAGGSEEQSPEPADTSTQESQGDPILGPSDAGGSESNDEEQNAEDNEEPDEGFDQIFGDMVDE